MASFAPAGAGSIQASLGSFPNEITLKLRQRGKDVEEVEETLPYEDVLEVFVRVNSGGTVLTKSDLVFSTVILNSPSRNLVQLPKEFCSQGLTRAVALAPPP